MIPTPVALSTSNVGSGIGWEELLNLSFKGGGLVVRFGPVLIALLILAACLVSCAVSPFI